MYDPKTITSTQLESLIQALNQHRLTTIPDLRRVERLFAALDSPELTAPMTAAWQHYTTTHLLPTLRALSPAYPPPPSLLTQAHALVLADPASNSSWNLTWLVLRKILSADLIPAFAKREAGRREMWGGREAGEEEVGRLAGEFERAWEGVVRGVLGGWEVEPKRG